MFGYIKICKEELKICEYEAYRAIYGSLCNQLQKDYGILARLTLNYDITFFILLRMSVLDAKATVRQGRCPLNPMAKCNHIVGDTQSLRYGAALGIMMTYYKCKDNLYDEGFFHKIPAGLALPFVALWNKKACKRFPEAGKLMREYISLQAMEEQAKHGSFDRYCHPTAMVLGRLFALDISKKEDQFSMERIGYHVGKWVYMMDALDDYKADQKRKRFNPIRLRMGESASQKEICDFLTQQSAYCLDVACETYDQLNRKTFAPLIRNIFVLGLPQVENEIIRKVMQQ